jgi:hypothetical protein
VTTSSQRPQLLAYTIASVIFFVVSAGLVALAGASWPVAWLAATYLLIVNVLLSLVKLGLDHIATMLQEIEEALAAAEQALEAAKTRK